jgi:hypothetical protein
MGFSREARVAGSQTASSATADKIAGTPTNTTGSHEPEWGIPVMLRAYRYRRVIPEYSVEEEAR